MTCVISVTSPALACFVAGRFNETLAEAKVIVQKDHRFIRHFVEVMVVIFALDLSFG
jgi:hypothetical protein